MKKLILIQTYPLFLSIILTSLISYFIQTQAFLSPDVAFLLHATSELLAGGTYTENFFETNPPMIFYLYSPVFLLIKLTSIHFILAFQMYVLFLASFSALMSGLLLKKLIPDNKIVFYSLFYTLLYSLFLLPVYAFGQREHLLMIFMLPYLFSAALSVKKTPIHPVLAVVIGMLAGLVFALKPFFLVPLILIECYFIFAKRHFFGWVRVESVTILSVLMLYLFVLYLFHPDYLNLVLPLVMHFYFISAKQTWSLFFSFSFVAFCLGGIVSYFLFHKKNRYPVLSHFLMLALIGMTAAFIISRIAWFYHCLPAIGLSCLLLSLYFSQTFSSEVISFKKIILLFCTGSIIFFIPLHYNYLMLTDAIEFKKSAPQNKFVSYINSLPEPHFVYCFSATGTVDCFPFVYQIKNSTYSGRFPFFWWYLGLQKKEKTDDVSRDKNYLIERVAEDLKRYPNNIVIVKNYSLPNQKSNVNLIADFSSNKKFRDAWAEYHHLITLSGYQLYRKQDARCASH